MAKQLDYINLSLQCLHKVYDSREADGTRPCFTEYPQKTAVRSKEWAIVDVNEILNGFLK